MIFNLIVSLVLSLVRMHGVRNDIFKDIAHLYVGGCFGAWLIDWKKNKRYLYLALILSAIETACFLYFRSVK